MDRAPPCGAAIDSDCAARWKAEDPIARDVREHDDAIEIVDHDPLADGVKYLPRREIARVGRSDTALSARTAPQTNGRDEIAPDL
jgi:hypothetical protein